MTKPTPRPAGNFFEDFRLGQHIEHATPRTITDGECALYIALTGARQPVHCATPVAQDLGYPSKPVDDLLAFHIAFAKTVPDISVNAVANLGYADVRFLRPVYVGDTLSTASTVIGLKQNSNGKSGVVYVRSESRNQHSEVVLSWVRWVMVHKHDLQAPAPETVIPTLPEVVIRANLAVPRFLRAAQLDAQVTGSARLWNDYVIGERIAHPAGMTVEEADHTLATKLYQNNARLHFDALMMQDSPFKRRLMYGGHVISVCRALSYDGLENVISIAAINGGTHSNPSFGGDTFYAVTEVLEKWELPGHHDLGALRLRLIGLRNLPADQFDSLHIEQDGKSGYHPQVVLDLDYTVLMPRR
ncbi:MaoC family dehydratase [Pseudomethylobacillus aquaticus]|uniref:MaoC family dehydratase n=1 Tax=Pseudomethylobacillus aquaticus TaxID=2676064 RepID=A0A3N0UZ77_9PROT|nr:MaoC family dehydratase [Pseudomethylobacillus aquaticus]ROH85551.1 MaoC family dehydratase [Pseudomethylobacillus aquaticus]